VSNAEGFDLRQIVSGAVAIFKERGVEADMKTA